MKNSLIKSITMKNVNFEVERECSICGMDEWCGTDGCPLDPQ